jgi:hypothetical protein
MNNFREICPAELVIELLMHTWCYPQDMYIRTSVKSFREGERSDTYTDNIIFFKYSPHIKLVNCSSPSLIVGYGKKNQ